MSTPFGLLVGGLLAALLWQAMRDTFAAPLFARANHRGAVVPVGAGLILVLTAIALAAVERGLDGFGVEQRVLRVGDVDDPGHDHPHQATAQQLEPAGGDTTGRRGSWSTPC